VVPERGVDRERRDVEGQQEAQHQEDPAHDCAGNAPAARRGRRGVVEWDRHVEFT